MDKARDYLNRSWVKAVLLHLLAVTLIAVLNI